MPVETQLTGLIIPMEWNPEGEITAFALAMMDENIIALEPESPGCRLLPYIRKKVELWGIFEGRQNAPVFRVHSLRPLENARAVES